MNGLDLFRSPKTAADEIADIVSAQCPPLSLRTATPSHAGSAGLRG